MSTYQLQQSANFHRQKAEAYDALVLQLQRIESKQEHVPAAELVDAMNALDLCLVPRDLLLNVRECLDPEDCSTSVDSESIQAYADKLRDILFPHLAEPSVNLELSL